MRLKKSCRCIPCFWPSARLSAHWHDFQDRCQQVYESIGCAGVPQAFGELAQQPKSVRVPCLPTLRGAHWHTDGPTEQKRRSNERRSNTQNRHPDTSDAAIVRASRTGSFNQSRGYLPALRPRVACGSRESLHGVRRMRSLRGNRTGRRVGFGSCSKRRHEAGEFCSDSSGRRLSRNSAISSRKATGAQQRRSAPMLSDGAVRMPAWSDGQ